MIKPGTTLQLQIRKGLYMSEGPRQAEAGDYIIYLGFGTPMVGNDFSKQLFMKFLLHGVYYEDCDSYSSEKEAQSRLLEFAEVVSE